MNENNLSSALVLSRRIEDNKARSKLEQKKSSVAWLINIYIDIYPLHISIRKLDCM